MMLEAKFDEYDRMHKLRRNINSMKDDLERQAPQAGLHKFRAHYIQDRLMHEFKNQIESVKNSRSSRFANAGRRSLQNFRA